MMDNGQEEEGNPEGMANVARQAISMLQVDENEEQKGMEKVMPTREGIVKEVAKIVKSFYNADNPNVGPFRGGEGIALDCKKQVAEKFGDQAGEFAEQLAGKFIEKLTMEWQHKHGNVGDDGLARLKELVQNIKGRVESIGDVGGHPGKNIMPAQEEGADMDKIPAYIRKQKQQSQDTAQKATDQRNKDAGAKVWNNPRLPKESAEMESILKLAGLAK